MSKEFDCEYCGRRNQKPSGSVNRARARGLSLYCDRVCAGLSHRKHKTDEQKRAEKAEYDRRRRQQLGDRLNAEKREARLRLLASNPDLVRAREKVNRDANRGRHAEYCRRPEYREWKKSYDRQYRAERFYGPFADAFLVLQDLENEIATRATRYEIYMERGTINKTQKRKREYEQAIGC